MRPRVGKIGGRLARGTGDGGHWALLNGREMRSGGRKAAHDRPGQEPRQNGPWPPPLPGRGWSASVKTPQSLRLVFGRFVVKRNHAHAWFKLFGASFQPRVRSSSRLWLDAADTVSAANRQ